MYTITACIALQRIDVDTGAVVPFKNFTLADGVRYRVGVRIYSQVQCTDTVATVGGGIGKCVDINARGSISQIVLPQTNGLRHRGTGRWQYSKVQCADTVTAIG